MGILDVLRLRVLREDLAAQLARQHTVGGWRTGRAGAREVATEALRSPNS